MCRGEHVRRNAGERGSVVDIQAIVVGRVEHVVLESRREIRELFLHDLEARLARGIELGPGETEVAKLVLDELLLRRFHLRESGRGGERLVASEKPLVLPELGVERGDLGQIRVVRLAQRRRIEHGIEVTHLAPGAIEAILNVGERRDEIVPGAGERAVGDALDGRARLREKKVDRGTDVLRRDLVEAGKLVEVEQRIGSERFVLSVHCDVACGFSSRSSRARSSAVPTFAQRPS